MGKPKYAGIIGRPLMWPKPPKRRMPPGLRRLPMLPEPRTPAVRAAAGTPNCNLSSFFLRAPGRNPRLNGTARAPRELDFP